MPLSKISIKRFRCFEEINLDLSPGVNFFYGTNGSGKTSILESIFIFSSGKSFKSSNLSSLINFNFDNFSLKAFDTARGYIVEINKDRNKPISVQLNNSKITTSKLIREFPCSPIHNNTFSFADASPDFRRKLLDRSIFIADDSFSSNWFSFYRSLKQRNSLLKKGATAEINAWNESFIKEGNSLSILRRNFFELTLLEFKNFMTLIEPKNVFNFFDDISISFFSGWDSDESLKDTLDKNSDVDQYRKTTTKGPHKADIKFLINNIDARQLLSRGEQKFFSILWSCSQHEVLKKHFNLSPTLIIDDIKSELDDRVFELFVDLLKYNENQVIFSCIDDHFSSKIELEFNDFKKFHVEQLG